MPSVVAQIVDLDVSGVTALIELIGLPGVILLSLTLIGVFALRANFNQSRAMTTSAESNRAMTETVNEQSRTNLKLVSEQRGLLKKIMELNQRVSDLEQNKRDLEKRDKAREQDREELSKTVTKLRDEVRRIETALTLSEQHNQSLRDENESLRQQVNALKARIEELEAEVQRQRQPSATTTVVTESTIVEVKPN